MRRVVSSKPKSARSVTTRCMPPVGSPRSRRVSLPSIHPGLVMKSTCPTKRRFSCFIATIIWARLEMSLPPPVRSEEHTSELQSHRDLHSFPTRRSSDPPGARDEVDMSHKASLLVLHSDDHLGETRDVVAPTGARKARLRLRRIADEGRVEVSELVDLGAAHEAHIDIAALEEKQHLSGAQHHIGALGAALVVGRGWKLPGLNEGTDHAALKQDRETGAIEPLRERGSEQRDSDAREHHLAVLQLARG